MTCRTNWQKSSLIFEAFKSALPARHLNRRSAAQTGASLSPTTIPGNRHRRLQTSWEQETRSPCLVDSPGNIARRKPHNGARCFAPLVHLVVRQGSESPWRFVGITVFDPEGKLSAGG